MGHWIVTVAVTLIFSAATGGLTAATGGLCAATGGLKAPQEQVRIILRGGGTVEGTLLGYENGKYRLQTAAGVREIDVRDVVSVATPSPTPALPPTPTVTPQARTECEDALKGLDELHSRLNGQRSETETVLRTALTKAMASCLSERKASGIVEVFRRIVLWLPEADAAESFQRIAGTIEAESAARPADAFAQDLPLAFASEVARNPRFTKPQHARALQLVFVESDRLRERRLFAEETAYLARTSEAFPEGRPVIADRLTRAHLDYAQTLLDRGDADGAAREARAVLAAIPSQARARQILEKATAPPPTPPAPPARPLPRPEVDILLEDDESVGVHPDVARYFPHAKGLSYTYRRRDGTQISVLYDAVVKDGDALKIDYTLEEKAGDERARHAFQQFVSGGEVYRDTYGRKEVLLKFPARAGDSWAWAIGDATYSRRVTAVNAATRIGSQTAGGGAKAYTGCLVVEFVTQVSVGGRIVTVTTQSYFAPGVGLVRMDFLEDAWQKYGLELVDFSTARP